MKRLKKFDAPVLTGIGLLLVFLNNVIGLLGGKAIIPAWGIGVGALLIVIGTLMMLWRKFK